MLLHVTDAIFRCRFQARQVARRIAQKHGTGIGRRVVTVIPSNGERYLNSVMFAGQFDEIVAATA